MSVNVGVVGVGHHGIHHTRIYRELSGVELVGVVDTDRDRLQSVQEQYDVRTETNIADLLPDVDAVSVVVPTESHFDVTTQCLKSGTDVLVEKPMTRTLSEAEKITELAREKGAVLQVGHIERFNPAVRAFQDELRSTPRFVECHRLSPFRFRSADINVVLDVMIHDLDVLCSIVPGEVKDVESVAISVVTNYKDIANARLTFDSGCVVSLSASRISIKSLRKMRIFSEEAYYSLDFQEKELDVYEKPEILEELTEDQIKSYREQERQGELDTEELFKSYFDREEAVGDQKSEEPLKMELEEFTRSVRTKETPPVSGEDGLKVMKLASRIQNSWEESIP